MDAEDQVQLLLSPAEALVLFDWLHWVEASEVALPFRHKAEQVAVWSVSALLERALSEPFRSDYAETVRAAREQLVGGPG